MSVKVFSTKVVTGDNIFTSPTGDGTAILRGLAEIAVQREYLHFSVILIKTLSIGSATGIEPATSRSAVKRSTDWANPASTNATDWQQKILPISLKFGMCEIRRLKPSWLSPREKKDSTLSTRLYV